MEITRGFLVWVTSWVPTFGNTMAGAGPTVISFLWPETVGCKNRQSLILEDRIVRPLVRGELHSREERQTSCPYHFGQILPDWRLTSVVCVLSHASDAAFRRSPTSVARIIGHLVLRTPFIFQIPSSCTTLRQKGGQSQVLMQATKRNKCPQKHGTTATSQTPLVQLLRRVGDKHGLA